MNYFMSFPYPERMMSTFASTSLDHKSSLPGFKTRTSIRSDTITKLTGADNYQIWETQVEYLHISIDDEEIVLDNLQLLSDATAEELQLYRKIFKNPLAIRIQTLALDRLAPYPPWLSCHKFWIHVHYLYYQENPFTFHVQLQKVMLLHQDVSAYEISLFIQLYETEWATLYRLSTSTSQVNSKSEQYRIDFATLVSYDLTNWDFLLASMMEKCLNEVDNISTKDTSSFEDVNHKCLNLHSASRNADLASHTFGN
jgi:hypothetical protein